MRPADYEHVIPPNNPAVARIMQEQGVGRRRAYVLAKREGAKAIDIGDVKPSQRLNVMAALLSDPAPRTIPGLLANLHRAGVKIDAHDVVKTLWALQKLDWITFRQKARGDFFAIKVKPKGAEGYDDLFRQRSNGQLNHAIAVVEADARPEAAAYAEEMALSALREEAEEATDRYFQTGQSGDAQGAVTAQAVLKEAEASVALDHDPDMQTLSIDTIPPELHDDIKTIVKTAADPEQWVAADLHLIQELILRGLKVQRLNAAAAILEEVGEADIAIFIYEKAGISPFEREVLTLIERLEGGTPWASS